MKSKKLVDTEEAARVLGASKRTVERWYMAGKIEGQFCAGGKGGGRGGQVLKVWIDDSAAATESTDGSTQQQVEATCSDRRRDRYKVHRGEPGCRVITPLINGEPIINIEAYLKPSGDRGGDLVSVGQLAVPGDRESPQLINNGTIPILQAPSGRSVNGDSLQILLERNDQPPESLDSGLPAVKKSTREKTAILPSSSPPSPCEASIPPSQGLFLSSNPTGCRERLGISDSTNRANRVCDLLPPEREERRECVASTGLTSDHIKTGQYPEDPAGQCAQATSGINLPAVIESQKSKEIGYLRMALLKAWRDKISENGKPRGQVTKEFLQCYNSGHLFPNIYDRVGKRSRGTLYKWDLAERLGGVPALVPQYRSPDPSPITEYEEYILLNTLLHQNQVKIGSAIKFTKTFLAYKKYPSPSSESKLRRFADDFRKTHYPAWVMAREGAKALNDKKLPYAERDWRLLTVGEGLVADGHRLNFQVIHPFTGKPCRATIVLFWDWKSSYPLGWEIMVEESTQCIASALRNAILTLGKIPKWLLIDNGKAFKAKVFTSEIELEDGILYGMFATLGIHTHFSQAYNPQEKPLERFWGTFNNWFERLWDSYSGNSIEDKPAWMRRNEKEAQVRHGKKPVPRIEDVQVALGKWIDFYACQRSRGRDGMKPGEIFKAEKGPGVDPGELYHLMMVKEKMQVHRNGVTFNGWHYYDEALSDIKDYVIGKYSLSDYSKIYCFYKRKFLCIAKPIEPVHPMACETEFPKDQEGVKQVDALKSRIRRRAKDLLGLIESGKGIDLGQSRSPEVADVVKAIEDKRKPKKLVSLSTQEEIEHFEIQVDEEGPVQFDSFSERYEFLLKKETLTEAEEAWIHQFETGEIAPGEWELIYGKGGGDAPQVYRHKERQKICIGS